MESSNRGRHVCPVCGLHFALNVSLKNHMLKRSHIPQSHFRNVNACGDSGVSTSSSDHSEIKSLNSDATQQISDPIEQHLAARLSENIKLNDFSDDALPPLSESKIEWVYKCSECQKGFDSKEKLVQHQRSKNHKGKIKLNLLENASMPFACDENAARASSNNTSVSHLKPFICAFCARSFDSSEKLAQHNSSEGHLAKLKEATDKSESLIQPLTIDSTSTFVCNYPGCGKVFDNSIKLSQHQLMKKHGAVLQSVGPTVEEKLNTLPQQDTFTEVENEFPSLTENSYTSMMRKTPLSNSLAEAQIRFDDAASRPYRKLCDQCDDFNEASQNKNFIFLPFIAKHILKRHAPPNYVRGNCPICTQKLDKTKNLLVHIARAHLLNRFQDEACFVCLRLCKDKNDLQEHTTAVHRYKCLMDECNSMFASKSLRDKHMLQKHGVHVCGREDCQCIFTSMEDKLRHMQRPHPVDSDSDSDLSSAYSHDLYRNRHGIERGAFSDPPRFHEYHVVESHHPYSADELSTAYHREVSDSTQNAAHKLFKNHMQFLRNALKELKEPLRKPLNPLCVDETLTLCNEVIADLKEIRELYSRSRQFAEKFDIDLIGK